MIIDKILLDRLTEQARQSSRLRQSYDLRTTPNDDSQRILNAMEPDTVLPIHRHMRSTETMTVLRGKVVQHLYNNEGVLLESIIIAPNSGVTAMSVEVGQWHRTESLKFGTVILEIKDGKYESLCSNDIFNSLKLQIVTFVEIEKRSNSIEVVKLLYISRIFHLMILRM